MWKPGDDLWTVDLFVTANLLLATALYLIGVRVLAAKGLKWSAVRTLSFLLGIALLALAYLGPFETLAHTYFWAHMGQHLIVMMLAAPFIVLSCPVALTVLATNGRTRAAIIRGLRSQVGLVLVNPIVTWVLFATVLVLLMTIPGLALFYGGMVRSKNVLSVLVQVITVFSLLVAVCGITLALLLAFAWKNGILQRLLSLR